MQLVSTSVGGRFEGNECWWIVLPRSHWLTGIVQLITGWHRLTRSGYRCAAGTRSLLATDLCAGIARLKNFRLVHNFPTEWRRFPRLLVADATQVVAALQPGPPPAHHCADIMKREPCRLRMLKFHFGDFLATVGGVLRTAIAASTKIKEATLSNGQRRLFLFLAYCNRSASEKQKQFTS
uniref:Uncharacterized protein n=1 Tax=Rubinisphaera brasiliensis (strain ATCC 49424 / DSM 5305 / JCM 21570 / IAM 15109 / NBRC 103401 / IFAM 1448) TaxID=756272 RepID=F0SIH9_RUBBR|nr:hypothetical protein Plabr_2003 [Rubinisphaera brasiliensis DSM 5305]